MKKLLVIYKCDNGYDCGCCGQQWEERELYELRSNANVQKFLKEEEKSVKEAYDKPISGGSYGRFGIAEAFIVSEEIKIEQKEEE